MGIVEIKDNQKEEWNEFAIRNGGSFLQSWEWGDFQESLGRKIWRLEISENKKISAVASLVRYDLPFGKSYLYSPRSTLTFFAMAKNVRVFEKVRELAKKEKAIFLRIDLELEYSEENRKILQDLGFRKAPREIQPKKTLILDITKSEEELLARMHQKTRYNIHLAEKHGISIRIPYSVFRIPQFEDFWRLMQETAKRDKFHPHPEEYYQKMLEAFRPTADSRQPTAKLFSTEYKNEIIAANIVVFFGRRATYLHGASCYNHRSLMAPYLLQWEQIKEAKKLGCAEYDFWGVDEKRWPGITRFKNGFACPSKFSEGKFCRGGREIGYVGAWDFVFDEKLYAGHNMLTKIRSLI